jgi:hypothetical protein
MPKKKESKKDKRVVGFIGVGLDNRDGETRVTKSEYFVLLGGSQSTHERMQDTAIRFTDELAKRGKALHETEPDEVMELLHRARQ